MSSVGTLVASAPGDRAVDETMRRAPESTRNDYFRSKILADRVVEEALARHEDLWAAFVLPGFMNGPGDAGPTSAGQTAIDFAAGRLPGVIDARFSYVDARERRVRRCRGGRAGSTRRAVRRGRQATPPGRGI